MSIYAIAVRTISDSYVGKLMFDLFRILTVCEYKRVDEEEGDGGKLEVNFCLIFSTAGALIDTAV